MDAERIRAAALRAQYALEFWSKYLEGEQLQPAADAAHILGKLASGEWVLCAGKPTTWAYSYQSPHSGGLVWRYENGPWNGQYPQDAMPLHARITEEP